MLTELGCSIEVASNGREALAALRDEAFDLVLMDCQMPEMDGFEAVRRFRASADHGYATPANAPIVALTANALAGDAERCIAAGFDDYWPSRSGVNSWTRRWHAGQAKLRSEKRHPARRFRWKIRRSCPRRRACERSTRWQST